MRKRISASSVIATVAAALTIGLSSAARAQQADTTKRTTSTKTAKSATRIKIKKGETRSAGGEVAPPARPDTAVTPVVTPPPVAPDTTTHVDTAMTADTTRAVDTTTRVAPVDTTTRPKPLPVVSTRFGTFYIGVGGGTSIPAGDIYNGYNPGFNISLPMGWDSNRWPLGLRFDLSYDRLMARSTFRNNGQTTAVITTNGGYSTGSTSTPTGTTYGGTTGSTTGSTGTSGGYTGTARIANTDAALASAMLDAKLRLPFFGSNSSTALYVVGGGGLHYFFNYASSLALTNPAAERAKFAQLHAAVNSATSSTSYSTGGYSAVTRPGANAGVGMQWGVGPANMFIEGRYVTVLTKDRPTNYWPVLFGITWR
jgi:hypothetical protein